jgi:hypothetical protein
MRQITVFCPCTLEGSGRRLRLTMKNEQWHDTYNRQWSFFGQQGNLMWYKITNGYSNEGFLGYVIENYLDEQSK